MMEYSEVFKEVVKEKADLHQQGGSFMSYIFPKNLYTDVRIEHLFSTEIRYTLGELNECKVRQYSAAFIRVYDGDRPAIGGTSG